jgi:hypothetical protein
MIEIHRGERLDVQDFRPWWIKHWKLLAVAAVLVVSWIVLSVLIFVVKLTR